jgi:uncharacterized protein YndB with AHSA1/START domain/predicted SnoaL-like aldol condensation-catalyzing enzyme
MIGETRSTQRPARSELVITRIFDAPRELVWKAWTDPEHIQRWWGPKDFTAPACKMDFRVGGKYLFCMRSPAGRDYWSTGVYREIIPFERIVCTDSFADAEGNIVPATYYDMSPDFPLEMLVTVTFEDHEGKTKMTLKHSGLPAGEMSEQTGTGWNESFDKLAESLRERVAAAEGNKEAAISFLKLASSGKVREAYSRFVGAGFKHHNPFFEGSADALRNAMEENARQNPDKRLEVKHAIAEGSFVAVHAHVQHKPGERGAVVMHIFRFENGRIVELWDVGQPVPDESPNQYGMF